MILLNVSSFMFVFKTTKHYAYMYIVLQYRTLVTWRWMSLVDMLYI